MMEPDKQEHLSLFIASWEKSRLSRNHLIFHIQVILIWNSSHKHSTVEKTSCMCWEGHLLLDLVIARQGEKACWVKG